MEFEYNPENSSKPLFIVMSASYPGMGFRYRKNIGDGNIKLYEDDEHVVKLYFNPEKFPKFDRIVEVLQSCKKDDLNETITRLYEEKQFEKKPGRSIFTRVIDITRKRSYVRV
jgi:hypothetical protein